MACGNGLADTTLVSLLKTCGKVATMTGNGGASPAPAGGPVRPSSRGDVVAEWQRGTRWFRRWACGCSEYHQGRRPVWVRLRWCSLHAPRGVRFRPFDRRGLYRGSSAQS
jgi:hypothetical protein